MENLIQVVDEKHNLCFIPYDNSILPTQYCNYTKVQVTQWFNCATYDVHHIDRKGIYFTAPKLAYTKFAGREGFNVNYDYLYQGSMPRFRLYDADKERHYSSSRFIALSGCEYRKFVESGLAFSGNKSSVGLITINFCSARQLLVSNNTFNDIHNPVLYVEGTDNVWFNKNKVSDITGTAVTFSRGCSNARVTQNLFEDCGLGLNQSFCVNCGESEYYIANNTFRDFGYGAIGVGIWYGHQKEKYSGGIIEHNEIYFTPTYFAEAWKHTLMDSGAIYTWTQNDNVIIRYNYIHDYTGAGDNRGIFCDDGASNLKIYGNVIVNIPNCYSIDSRAVKDFGKGYRNNENNFMAQNVVDGRVRFMGYEGEERHVVKSGNIRLKSAGDNSISDKYEDLELEVKDEEVELKKGGKLLAFSHKYKNIVRKAGRK